MDFLKDLLWDFIMDLPRDLPKDLPRDFLKTLLTDFPMDLQWDFHKDLLRGFPRDVLRWTLPQLRAHQLHAVERRPDMRQSRGASPTNDALALRAIVRDSDINSPTGGYVVCVSQK